MGRAIELSLLAIIVIVIAFVVIPRVMIEIGKLKTQPEPPKPELRAVKDESVTNQEKQSSST